MEEKIMRFIMKALMYIILMNAVLFIGACIVGSTFTFSLLFNVVTPVICALASYEMEKRRERKARRAR